MQPKWITRFMQMAELVASWSKDPSTQVGAVIVDDKQRVVSVGFNGFPRGVQDNPDVLRDIKLARTIHAEANAILFANRPLAGCSLFVTRPPCANCAALIIQTGISKVFIKQPDADFMDRWGSSVSESTRMFVEAGIEFQMLAGTTDDGWIDWHDGACPVPGGTLVQCRLREDVGWNMETRPAGEWEWYWHGDVADIVAYRVVGGTPQVGERDPNGIPPGAPGAKLDAGKLKAGVLEDFSLALKAVAEIGTFGANKYSRGGWQHAENGRERYTDAMWRHLLAGGGTDDQSNLLHEAHFAWNVLARLELLLRQTKSD